MEPDRENVHNSGAIEPLFVCRGKVDDAKASPYASNTVLTTCL